jgi:hypothetical protein
MLGDFVRALARRIASFPAGARALVKDRVNAIALATEEDFRRDSDLFLTTVQDAEAQRRLAAAFEHGLQTRDPELAIARMIGELTDGGPYEQHHD